MSDRAEFLDFVEKLDLRGMEGFPIDDSDDESFDEEEITLPQRKKMKFIMQEIETNSAS